VCYCYCTQLNKDKKAKKEVFLSLLMNKYRATLNFCGSVILQLVVFCVLQELFFAIGKSLFFLLEINSLRLIYCQEVAFNLEL